MSRSSIQLRPKMVLTARWQKTDGAIWKTKAARREAARTAPHKGVLKRIEKYAVLTQKNKQKN